ncbi:hypothetical protein SDC9_212315 [bioreactor metagenome]|uniref:Uncharacterized protein n=1 Tax=bioreactor metagenome TaxID=1076179 RepID=A0A645JN72_9ZZZZ
MNKLAAAYVNADMGSPRLVGGKVDQVPWLKGIGRNRPAHLKLEVGGTGQIDSGLPVDILHQPRTIKPQGR